MAVNEKDRIFPEDALPVIYECRVADAETGDSYGEPDQPISAYARILDKNTGTFMILGADEIGVVTIEPKTTTRGALLKFVVTSDLTVAAGDYTVFITATFADGTILTEDRDFKVLEFL